MQIAQGLEDATARAVRNAICATLREVSSLTNNRHALRVLKLLEIGAGGERAGKHAGEFTRRVGSSSELRRVLLCYANRRSMRAGREQFKALAAVASDVDWNPENDYRFDVHSVPIRARSIHLVVAVGPKGYGFWRERTTKPFLAEVARILQRCRLLCIAVSRQSCGKDADSTATEK